MNSGLASVFNISVFHSFVIILSMILGYDIGQ
jgi:hypothetical protein